MKKRSRPASEVEKKSWVWRTAAKAFWLDSKQCALSPSKKKKSLVWLSFLLEEPRQGLLADETRLKGTNTHKTKTKSLLQITVGGHVGRRPQTLCYQELSQNASWLGSCSASHSIASLRAGELSLSHVFIPVQVQSAGKCSLALVQWSMMSVLIESDSHAPLSQTLRSFLKVILFLLGNYRFIYSPHF